MLIVCTRDNEIRDTAQEPLSDAKLWGTVTLLPSGTKPAANRAFVEALKTLRRDEPLCLSAHGNDEEIGDETAKGWGWDSQAIAALLAEHAPRGWTGPILIHACAKQVSNFSAHLAVALDTAKAFDGLWCYGYNKAVPSASGYPDPAKLDKKPDLQGTRVSF